MRIHWWAQRPANTTHLYPLLSGLVGPKGKPIPVNFDRYDTVLIQVCDPWFVRPLILTHSVRDIILSSKTALAFNIFIGQLSSTNSFRTRLSTKVGEFCFVDWFTCLWPVKLLDYIYHFRLHLFLLLAEKADCYEWTIMNLFLGQPKISCIKVRISNY